MTLVEKAFDYVPQKVIWWGLRKLGVEEWIVRLVQGMYANARSRVSVGKGFSQEFEVILKSLALHHCAGGLVT